MGLFDLFNEWRQEKTERKIQEMQAQGKCPSCYGKGIDYPIGFHDFFYTQIDDCPGCNGSGLFSDWAEINQRTDLI